MKINIRNSKGDSILRLFTQEGKIIFQKGLSLNQQTIELPALSKGSYFIRLYNNKSILTTRLEKR